MPQGFDVEGARKAGYSDDDILAHLAGSRQFNVNAATQAGYSKDDIINYLSTNASSAPRRASGSWDETAASAIPFSPTEAHAALVGIPGQLKQMSIGAAQSAGKAGLGAAQWAQDIRRQVGEFADQPGIINKLKYLVSPTNATVEPRPSEVTPTPTQLQANTPGQAVGQGLGNMGMLMGAATMAGPSIAAQTAVGAMGGGALGATPEHPYAATVLGGTAPITMKAGLGLARKAGGIVSPDRALQGLDASTISGQSRGMSPQEQQSTQLFTRAIGPSDPDFQRNLPRALDEMKTAEASLGPQSTAEGHLKLVQRASSDLNDRFNSIVTPQKTVTIPGSAQAIARAKLEAIPDYIRIQDPEQFQRLTDQVMAENSKDLTLGDLNKLRISGNKILNPKYGAAVNAQLTKDEAVNTAMLKAQTDTARQLLYSGLDKYGLGGGDEARNIGQGLGSLLTVNDPLQKSVNAAVAQRAPMTIGQRASKALQIARNPVGTSITGFGRSPTIDDDLVQAMRRWPGRSTASQVNLRATAPTNRQLQAPSLFDLPGADTSSVTGTAAPMAQRTNPRLLGPGTIQLPETTPGPNVDAVGHGLTGGRPSQMITGRMSPQERIELVEYLRKILNQ